MRTLFSRIMSLSRVIEVLLVSLRLGLTSFGGPVAHLGFFRGEYVQKRKWLSDGAFADLVALCQFLPGPASSQVGYAIGVKRAGWLGGLAAWVGFTAPSAALMIGFAIGLASFEDLPERGWLAGLKLAALAVVAHAVWSMAMRLCPDATRATIAIVAAMIVLIIAHPVSQIGVIAGGCIIGVLLLRDHQAEREEDEALEKSTARSRAIGVVLLGAFGAILIGLPIIAQVTESLAIDRADSFYRAGSLVFGGGHVVLPLLESEVVRAGWVSRDTFLAGYGAAQAVPGPLFSFSAFLGTAMETSPRSLTGGLLCLGAIYLPSFLLVSGVLPWWDRLRRLPIAGAALAGANAAVVGLLLGALYDPVFTAAVTMPGDVAIALGAWALLGIWKVPAWAVVILCGVSGYVFL